MGKDSECNKKPGRSYAERGVYQCIKGIFSFLQHRWWRL